MRAVVRIYDGTIGEFLEGLPPNKHMRWPPSERRCRPPGSWPDQSIQARLAILIKAYRV